MYWSKYQLRKVIVKKNKKIKSIYLMENKIKASIPCDDSQKANNHHKTFFHIRISECKTRDIKYRKRNWKKRYK